MGEHFWLSMITILLTLTLGCVGILMKLLFSWRAAFIEDMEEIKKSVKDEINKFCQDNANAHEYIWERINHHKHDVEGRVVISN